MRSLPAKTCRPYSLLCAVKIVKQYGPSKMGGDGHGHGEKFKIPDWKQYKVDGIKELEWTRQSLADKGLRDPWLRRVLVTHRWLFWPLHVPKDTSKCFVFVCVSGTFWGCRISNAGRTSMVAEPQALGELRILVVIRRWNVCLMTTLTIILTLRPSWRLPDSNRPSRPYE